MSERITSELLDRIDAWKAYVDAPERIHTTLWLSEQLTTAKQYIEYLRSQTPPHAVTLEYSEGVGDAGQQYLDSVSLNGWFRSLPGTFRWEELFNRMVAAAEKPAPTPDGVTAPLIAIIDKYLGERLSASPTAPS